MHLLEGHLHKGGSKLVEVTGVVVDSMKKWRRGKVA